MSNVADMFAMAAFELKLGESLFRYFMVDICLVYNTCSLHNVAPIFLHDDVVKWKHFPRYWPFVRGMHRSSVNSPHKGHWRGALMFSVICVWINAWVNNREAGDLRRHRAHCDVMVMSYQVGVTLYLASHPNKFWWCCKFVDGIAVAPDM